FANLSDEDIYEHMQRMFYRHSKVCNHDLVPDAISRIGKRIYNDAVPRRMAAKLRCAFLRQIRTALWLVLQEEPHQSAFRLLSNQPLFRTFINDQFHAFTHIIFTRSANEIVRLIGHYTDSPLDDNLIRRKKEELKMVFPDLREGFPPFPPEPFCISH